MIPCIHVTLASEKGKNIFLPPTFNIHNVDMQLHDIHMRNIYVSMQNDFFGGNIIQDIC